VSLSCLTTVDDSDQEEENMGHKLSTSSGTAVTRLNVAVATGSESTVVPGTFTETETEACCSDDIDDIAEFSSCSKYSAFDCASLITIASVGFLFSSRSYFLQQGTTFDNK